MEELTQAASISAKGSETKRRIFAAAVTEFSERGYAGARIDRIASAAGVNKQRIYAYFGDKDGLYLEVWQHTSDLITDEDQSLCDLGEADIPRLGPILLERYVSFHERHPEFWRIFVMENLMENRHERHAREGLPYAHVRSLYQKGQDEGFHDPNVSFETFLFVLIGVTFFYASNWKTMSQTLTTNLADPHVKSRIFGEIGHWLFGEKHEND